jgi:NADH-quinone oxidoreductase subunit G
MRADLILPSAAYTEKNGTYVNTEGRVQFGRLAVFPPGDAREDWTIIRALAGQMNLRLGFDSLIELRQAMIAAVPSLAVADSLPNESLSQAGQAGLIDADALQATIDNYYMTDPISRASKTMADCSQLFVTGQAAKATGTHG